MKWARIRAARKGLGPSDAARASTGRRFRRDGPVPMSRKLPLKAVVVSAFAIAAGANAATTMRAGSAGPLLDPIAAGADGGPGLHASLNSPLTLGLRKAIVPPGGIIPWHCHPGPVRYIVVRGQLTTFAPDGGSRRLEAGDGGYEPAGVARMAKNRGKVPAILHLSAQPPPGMPPTIRLAHPNAPCRP